jgi:DNA-binding transcriptional ArsR family regulator
MRKLQHPEIKDIPITDILHALSDPVRLEIVRLAAQHDALPCSDFFQEIPKSTLSHHWRVLRQAGLIFQRTEGTKKLNSLRKEEIDRVYPGLLDAVLVKKLSKK